MGTGFILHHTQAVILKPFGIGCGGVMSADLISRFGKSFVVFTGDTNGSYVDGFWVPPSKTRIDIVASVQRLTAKEVLLLEEGDRQKASFKVFTTYPIKVQKDGEMFVSDEIVIDGVNYMFVSVEDWFVNGAMDIKYYRGNCVSVNPDPS